ncbi:MAG: YggS family pyridoxal phosphate-dependent enzyme [Candidatus Omnitrophica bacterium]|nr:YggS family pyridoxal phosphate-dependent enzyme [Candidatus Omnitrophota bacterium]
MIKDNIAKARERVKKACLEVGRIHAAVTIIAVSKNRSVEEIKEAITCGVTDIGENKVQEALKKYYELRVTDYGLRNIKWHMIGHLQTNKVKEAVKIFDLIHSVDSLRLAVEINKAAAKINKVQDVLIEVKTSPEEAKYGLNPDKITGILQEILQLRNVRVKGLMTIAALVDNPEQARPYFRMLRELRDKINQPLVLSMGMTDDFQVAVEEGADMVRIGRGIFSRQ